jgi:lipopolysaccharide transport system ATP-binding protein
MSDDIAISLENISKVYKRYHRPADRLKEIFLPGKQAAKDFWALRNVNLKISKGETIGIVGRNGSGKSTLLQIIAGTLQPTEGEVTVVGRVSALLELGSGFNPEFTGSQNIFFNGQVLGLTRQDIEDRFDEIASFADIGEFINQPVKTYSSGMFVRLAFAVAISAHPDILVVDEALSVGDEAFQRKCFARIYAIQEAGSSVLFVSHTASSIVELCDETVLMDQGEILLRGLPKAVVAQYQRLIYAPEAGRHKLREELRQSATIRDDDKKAIAESVLDSKAGQQQPYRLESDQALYDPNLKPQHSVAYQSRGAKIKEIRITNSKHQQANLLRRGHTYHYCYSVHFSEDAHRVRFGMLIKTISGFELGGGVSHLAGQEISFVTAGSIINVQFEFTCFLLSGTYFCNAGLLGRKDDADVYLDRRIDALMFRVMPDSEMHSTGLVDFQVTPSVSDRLLMQSLDY